MNRDRLDAAIQQIRNYTTNHTELRAAHHFLYDLPLDKGAGTPEVVVMGINPGETERDRQAYPGPTEETWNHDFHERASVGRSRGSDQWRRNAAFFADGKAVVFTELFLWSSRNGEEFKQRFGPVWGSRHLSFCTEMNQTLLSEYQPKSVIFVGVSDSAKVAKEFGLTPVYTFVNNNHRLLEHFRDNFRPWFFTKHWSGSFGFSKVQKRAIKEYIQGAI